MREALCALSALASTSFSSKMEWNEIMTTTTEQNYDDDKNPHHTEISRTQKKNVFFFSWANVSEKRLLKDALDFLFN